MASNQFIFLERNIEKDRESFEKSVEYYADSGNKYQVTLWHIKKYKDVKMVVFKILLFPEGTDKTAWTTAKSNSFAKKNGLRFLSLLLNETVWSLRNSNLSKHMTHFLCRQLEYCLYPRVAGFYHLLTKMRESQDYFFVVKSILLLLKEHEI